MWNVVLMMHGMDIDFASRIISPEVFPPSKVDLVRLGQSFVADISCEITHDGTYHQLSIEQSSVGRTAHLAGKKIETVKNGRAFTYPCDQKHYEAQRRQTIA